MVLNHFKSLIINFIKFIKYPNCPKYINLSKNKKLLDVCFYYLILKFTVGVFILGWAVEIVEKMGFYNPLFIIDSERRILITIISAVILAPLIEEGVFRLFLGYYRHKSYFKWLYYSSAFLFGLIHIFNYEFDKSHYPFIFIITSTQIFSGLILGFTRIIYGFWYGVLLHFLFNLLIVICQYYYNLI